MKLSALFLASALLGAQAAPSSPSTPLLVKRVDNWCKIDPNLVDVDCRSKPGVGAGSHVRYINTGQRFGVNCIKVVGGRTWDWIPGWGCWTTSRATLSADPVRSSCEGLGEWVRNGCEDELFAPLIVIAIVG
ncbi:hypothetical protein BU23DRAFT_572934 [Bimuria novae-zelandiae CBS 107.79]|uniref:Uncharacterized protein n=1 Tax=Bimuria novae-zelandiae CBS 107.79 TaxID=1447943 RepID=A0A6A5UV07_9PLEO|nr:hypothetical protein BU23DRAFT_572934 [Bimuria novae-zelandiae CBS 107.79]